MSGTLFTTTERRDDVSAPAATSRSPFERPASTRRALFSAKTQSCHNQGILVALKKSVLQVRDTAGAGVGWKIQDKVNVNYATSHCV